MLGNDVRSPVLDAVPAEVGSPIFDAVPADAEFPVFDAVPADAESPGLDTIPSDVVEGPLPSCGPVVVMDWLPELPCGFWPAPVAIEASDDVPLFESILMLPMRPLVGSCDVEVYIPETDPPELEPVDMLSCEVPGFEVDVGPPALDVLPSADPLVPVLPTLVSWLDGVPIVVDDAP